MRWSTAAVLVLAAVTSAQTSRADGDGKTSDAGARPKAEAAFEALRKAAAAKDDAALTAGLPSKLVEKWREAGRDGGKPWRAALAARVASGKVDTVTENGNEAIARWSTTSPAATYEMFLGWDGKAWTASRPWAYCVGGGDVAKANGKKPAHVKLKVRKGGGPYGPSAVSFAHATQDPEQCKNRMDLWFCAGGHLHGSGGTMLSQLKATTLDAVAGRQSGGDWMDQVNPKAKAVYVAGCTEEDRKDFQVAFQVTSADSSAVEIDWKLVCVGTGAPADIHKPQPLVSNDGPDGCDGNCGGR